MNDELFKAIQSTARLVADRWPDVIDAEDMTQEICIRVMESPKALEVLEDANYRVRARYLYRVGQQIASKERDDREYFSGNYHYSTKEVRQMLLAGALTEVEWGLGAWYTDDEKVKVQFQDAVMSRHAARADLHHALKELTDTTHYAALYRRFVEHDTGDTRATHNAVKELTLRMNRWFAEQDEDYEGIRPEWFDQGARVEHF